MFEFASNQFFWTTVSFLILLGVAYKFALPPLFNMVEAQEAEKQRYLEALKENNEKAETLVKTYTEKLSDIQREAKAILESAKTDAEQIKKAAYESIYAERQTALSDLKKEFEFERKQLFDDVQAAALDAVITAAERALRVQLPKDTHEAIVKHNLSQFDNAVNYATSGQ